MCISELDDGVFVPRPYAFKPLPELPQSVLHTVLDVLSQIVVEGSDGTIKLTMNGPRRLPLTRAPVSSPSFGSERRAPSFQTFMRNMPSTKKEPPTQPPSRRTSSVYSRATRIWDAPPSWYDGPPPLPSTDRRFSDGQTLSASTPNLGAPDVSPLTPKLDAQLLLPRIYQPLLPSPSPTLAPYSRHVSDVPTLSDFLPGRDEEDPWRGLSLDEPLLSPSPPPLSPITNIAYSQSFSNLSTPPLMPYTPVHWRSRSDDSPPVARLTRPFDVPPGEQWATESVNDALSHMRLGSNISSRFDKLLISRSTGSEAIDERSLQSDEILSAEYRNKLVGEYKDLASPPSGHWKHEEVETPSDDSNGGRDLKLVPAPLFWTNRQKELYPRRAEYAQAKTGDPSSLGILKRNQQPPRKHRKKISLSSAPLKMVLPSQYKRKSMEKQQEQDSPITASLKKSLAMRLGAKKQEAKELPASPPRTGRGKPISKPLPEVPFQLHLPAMVYGDGPSPKQLPEQSKSNHQSPSSPPSSFPRSLHRHPIIEEAKHNHSHSGRSISNVFHKAQSSLRHSSESETQPRESQARVSSESTKALTSPEIPDERRFLGSGLLDKALDVKRERDRRKRVKDLKSSIRFVGKVDPGKAANGSKEKSPEQGQKRETFGEGWI